jgi:hypothetical protein
MVLLLARADGSGPFGRTTRVDMLALILITLIGMVATYWFCTEHSVHALMGGVWSLSITTAYLVDRIRFRLKVRKLRAEGYDVPF